MSCTAALGPPALSFGPVGIAGTQSAAAQLAVLPGHAYLIELDEHGNDALVELLDSGNSLIARADHPERRTGTRRALLTAKDASPVTIRVTGKESADVSGTINLRAFDLAVDAVRPECLSTLKTLAQADADYAAGEEIAAARAPARSGSARDAFLRAAAGYSAAEGALSPTEDRALRGQTALALAAVQYLNLQDWAQAAEWARQAAETLGNEDPYRAARARALEAAAWMELGSHGSRSVELLTRARGALESLSRFHLARGERYDAGLQLNNVTLTYLYEGRYPECVAVAVNAAHLFGAIHETQRQAQAWQNQALCLWGLGRLPEALHWFERAMAQIRPDSVPGLYVGVTNNTALVNYALGHFDESLRLFDRALSFSQKVQAQRDEAQSLYGIGVNYYAIGERARARQFLERSLAIRTVKLDGRGRMSALRSLATIDAEQGSVDEAIALDREALSLAVAPAAIGRIRIQLAAHTASAGRLEEAKAQLDAVLNGGADPLIQAEARLQRAMLLRAMDHPREALADLAACRPQLHRLGSITEEFEADLELARVRQALGQSDAALAAVDLALGKSDAMRLQTANPELRAQLQTPLRPAYDLKLELLREQYDQALTAGRQAEASAVAAAAFASADASRAHSFADVAAQTYPPAVRLALASELHRRQEIYVELSARRFALDARVDGSGSADPRAKHLMGDIAELQRQADTVNTLIAAGAAPAPKGVRGARVRTNLPLLPANTALVSYWLGPKSAYAWVISAEGIRWVRLPATATITQRAAAFHHSLTRLVDTPVERRLEDARALYGLIIQPIESSLLSERRWIVIPDGALDYVPFAALRTVQPGSGAFVALQHDIALTPAAWMLESGGGRAESHEAHGLLLVADPVYQADDPRLATLRNPAPTTHVTAELTLDPTRPPYRRLPHTAVEAAQIAAQFSAVEVQELTGLDATRERLLSLDWSKFRFIHIATHGIVDAQVPELSALILGSYDARGENVDGAVRVADLSLQTLNADVAVLSACDTALGSEVLSEGLVGIGSTMLARGARSVVASLWPVSDEIAEHLMTEFYRHLLHDSMNAPAALAAAMRSVISRDGSADPALWAAFQVSIVALGPGLPMRNAVTGRVATTGP